MNLEANSDWLGGNMDICAVVTLRWYWAASKLRSHQAPDANAPVKQTPGEGLRVRDRGARARNSGRLDLQPARGIKTESTEPPPWRSRGGGLPARL